MTSSEEVLVVARSQIGYREGSNNDNKYGRWYGMNNVPWCAIFVSWVAAQAGATDIIPRHSYTPNGQNWFIDLGRWGSTPKKGAIVYFDLNKSNERVDHVGIVESVQSDHFTTIEGNSGSGSNGVYRLSRSLTSVRGFGYPAYSVVPTNNPPPEAETHLEDDMVRLMKTNASSTAIWLVDHAARTKWVVPNTDILNWLRAQGIPMLSGPQPDAYLTGYRVL